MYSRFFLFYLSLLLSVLSPVPLNVAADTTTTTPTTTPGPAKGDVVATTGYSTSALAKCVPKAIDIPCFVDPCAVIRCATGTKCVRDTCLPCQAHCEPIAGWKCASDANCGRNQWCRLGKCVDFVNDGESCGGFVPAELQRRCKPTSTCVQTNPNIADLPGICRHKCKKNSDCYPPLVIRHWSDYWKQKQYYCSYEGACLPRGQCQKARDCYKPGNLFLSPYCVGFFRCKNGKCVKVCLSDLVVELPPKEPIPVPGPNPPPVTPEPRLVELKNDQDNGTPVSATGEFVEEEIPIDIEGSDGTTGGGVDSTPTLEEPAQLVDEAEKEDEDSEGQ